MNSPTIAQSIPPGPAKAKGSNDKAADQDADAFSISLEVAREEADGDTETTNITIQGVTTESDDVDGDGDTETTSITIHGTATGSGETGSGSDQTESDFTIEIETVVFNGANLASNLTASTVVGGGAVTVTSDGSFGVSGSVSGDSEVRLEVGETLTFELPPTEGEVVGGQVTITNLFGNAENTEGALVFAYDAADNLLSTYGVLGNDTGTVTVDIEVPFARLDIKAVDNQSWALAKNSNFGVGSISAMIASFVDDLSEGAGQTIGDILEKSGSLLSQLVDFGHTGKVHFEASSFSHRTLSNVGALTQRGRDNHDDQAAQDNYRLDAFDRQQNAATSTFRRGNDGFAN